MDEPDSALAHDIRQLLQKITRCSGAVELLISARTVRAPANMLDQFLTLRNLGFALLVDEADDSLFRANTKLRNFIEYGLGTVSPLHGMDENHEALLNNCTKLHSRYLTALQAGEDGESDLDEFVSWAYALGDAIDQSLARFDAHLSSNFSMAKTLRQRELLNKEAVSQAVNLSGWLSALASSPLRQRLEEDASCKPLLEVFEDAILSRGKMARRLERCTQSIQRLREKLNSSKAATHRHELLEKAASLAEQGTHFLSSTVDFGAEELARLASLTPKTQSSTPATFNPSQKLHALLGAASAAKAWKWGRQLEASMEPKPASDTKPGSLSQERLELPPKPIPRAFESLLDEMFATATSQSLCEWLATRHCADLDLDVSAQAFLAWTCAQAPEFFYERDTSMRIKTGQNAGPLFPVRIVDAEFEPELFEEPA